MATERILGNCAKFTYSLSEGYFYGLNTHLIPTVFAYMGHYSHWNFEFSSIIMSQDHYDST